MLTMYVYVCFILYLTILPVTGTCTCNRHGQQLIVQCNPYKSHQVEICFKNNSDATYLDFSGSGLTDIPKEIRFLKRLSTLILSNNRIPEIKANHLKPVANTLELVKLDSNKISVLKQGSLDHLVKVTHLDFSLNALHTIENGTFTDKLQALVDVQLPSNNLTELDSSVIFLPQGLRGVQTFSNVSYNQITQFTNSIRATIDIITINMSIGIIVENNKFTTIDYMLYAKMFNVTSIEQLLPTRNSGLNLRMNPFICDCRMYPVSVAIGSWRNVSHDPTNPIFDLACNTPYHLHGKIIYSVPKNEFNCTVTKDCPEHCTCVLTEALQLMTVTCTDGSLSSLPERVPMATKIQLKVQSKRLTEISNRNYLSNVTDLDLSSSAIFSMDKSVIYAFDLIPAVSLRDNALTRLPKEIQQLKFDKLRHLALAGNPFICDCHSLWLKHWLIRRKDFIDNEDAIRCSAGDGKGRSVVNVPDSSFTCPPSTEFIIVICITAGFVLFVILMIIYGKKTDIHVLLIHYFNCNLFRTKVSSDARFDVFVSHSSKNEEYVQSTFIPRLEGNIPPFRVCSFERHFDVGVQITENITRCISDSVATVLMVSNHFLQSDWCVHEFQESHKKQMRSKDAILIVIVLEELDDNLLDEDFKIYLRTHVYLDVNDKYFWPKLLRSLPLRQERHDIGADYDRTRLLQDHR